MSIVNINWDDLPEAEGELRAALRDGKKTALTVGVFDGLHRGHQTLIKKITEKAPELLPVVVTFRENPKKCAFLREQGAKSGGGFGENAVESGAKAGTPYEDIISLEEKISLLDSFGVPLCVIIDFSEHFSRISGRAFLESLDRYLSPAFIALGQNFHCGYRRDTDAAAFKALAEKLGIKAEIAPPVLEGGIPVSSSRIRAAIREGRGEEAALLLGRPYNRFQGV